MRIAETADEAERDFLQKAAKIAKLGKVDPKFTGQFFTEGREGSEVLERRIFVFFGWASSGQDQPMNAILQHLLVEID